MTDLRLIVGHARTLNVATFQHEKSGPVNRPALEDSLNADGVGLGHPGEGFSGGDRDVCVFNRHDEKQGEHCQQFHMLWCFHD